jgi:3-methyl-2-oxobutanoate hydroxymethyltransferase
MNYLQDKKPVTLFQLKKMHSDGIRIAMLTAYDASFAGVCSRAGVDVILVGDSLGNAIQGRSTTLPVTLKDMVYHTQCVTRGNVRSFVVTDMPFGTYHENPAQAMHNAAKIMASGAQMVKLEGGAFMAETVRFLVERGVPVCAHIGLTPQAVHHLGGYRVQGRNQDAAAQLKADALALEEAGAALIVMEMVPATLAKEITESLEIAATIGIGAGPDCDGQVLVLHDVLGVFPAPSPRFSRNFMEGASSIEEAVTRFVTAVKDETFPAAEHCF